MKPPPSPLSSSFHRVAALRVMSLALFVAAAIFAPRRTPAQQNSAPKGTEWLLGRWKHQVSHVLTEEFTWTSTQEGILGTLDQVDRDGNRTPITIYLISQVDERLVMKLQQPVPDKGASVTKAELDQLSRGKRLRRRAPGPSLRSTPTKRGAKFAAPILYEASGEAVPDTSRPYLFFSRGAKNLVAPLYVQLRIIDDRLVFSRHAPRGLQRWGASEFERVEPSTTKGHADELPKPERSKQ
jgi:hypothetical protein